MYVSHINWNDPKYIRAGIIPFTVCRNVTYYAFGLEPHIASLGDFGGHIEPSDSDGLDAALREYSEEALDVFGSINRNSVKDCHVLAGIDTAEILLPVTGRMYDYTYTFRKIIGNDRQHEVQDIIWLNKNQVLQAIDNPELQVERIKLFCMYQKIYDTLALNRSFICSHNT